MRQAKAKRPKVSILHEEIPPHFQELMQLNRLAEMGRMAANVAHELNSPLMVVQGFAENIEIMLDQPDVDRQEMRMQIVQVIKSCQRMSRIIAKMNRMSRGQKLRLHVIDLAEVSLNAVDLMRAQLSDYDIKLEFDYDHPLPIRCDGIQIEQVVLNILSNAVTALEAQADDRRIRISFETVGDWHMAKIWNNGPPIPLAVQERLMVPFFSTKDMAEGAGLGLAVSKSIMQVHQGDLSFRSDPDCGTEFVLAFPRPKENPWKQQEPQAQGHVFVLDQQVNYRKTMEEKMRLLGFQTKAFADFEEGFKAIRQTETIAGIFIDLLPGLQESLQFIKRLRRHLGPKGLIFVISNFPSAKDFKGELKSAGATEFFEKPIHSENFTFILKLLDSETAAQEGPTRFTVAAPNKAA